jgi:aconitate hydratase
LAPDQPVQCRITKPDGSTIEFQCTQTFSPEQIAWFHAGSALNIIRGAA